MALSVNYICNTYAKGIAQAIDH